MAFEIAEIAVGGGVLGLCALPQASDLTALQAWRADLVLTLVEGPELAMLSPDLIDVFAAAGIAHCHFPIADYATPRGDWRILALKLHARLATGSRIVIHCRGGCGRTGMIALRLMVEAGEEAEPAVARLRAARPCAVETEAQMDWATRPETAT
ncbi:protein-tyrosine phosphatase family protein [Pseudorhodobacter sp.]|uniref:protein-tyrosine phosphatase family protein n=1 Tax=Pseudorhodobacter sp. TaxID=1934400 RepID=UPI002647A555|nr:protein-tyrosine phosphatase family protein [Pseudorhodobacter sp.]MDN5788566.1 protein phosphatase [Pseudorhodobacter sp.]